MRNPLSVRRKRGFPRIPGTEALSDDGGTHILWPMKVDLYEAPLSQEAQKLLKDSRAVHELMIEIMESGKRRFEVKSGSQTLDVTASEAVAATSEA